MSRRRLRFGIKVAQMGGAYAEMQDAWLEADRLGFYYSAMPRRFADR